MLFARRLLLVEGPGDRIAVRLAAEGLGVDLDAEGLSVVPCGAKHSIPHLRAHLPALRIPFWVMHDEDDSEDPRNQAILDGAGDADRVFVIEPSLEGALGAGEKARDKPRRVAEALRPKGLEEYPGTVLEAVEALVREDPTPGEM